MLQFFLHMLAFFRDGIFPASCLGCGREGSFLCPFCEKTAVRLEQSLCIAKSDGTIDGPGTDLLNQQQDCFLDAVWAVYDFGQNPLIQKAIHGLKYDFLQELADPLGRLMAPTLADVIDHERTLGRSVMLCPLPLHRKRERWRGFNQASLLAHSAVQAVSANFSGQGFTVSPISQLLERTCFSRPQMELNREERKQNIHNAFRCLQPPQGPDLTVIIVDDVATTLATLHSAAQCLKTAGYERVCGLVLARVF